MAFVVHYRSHKIHSVTTFLLTLRWHTIYKQNIQLYVFGTALESHCVASIALVVHGI